MRGKSPRLFIGSFNILHREDKMPDLGSAAKGNPVSERKVSVRTGNTWTLGLLGCGLLLALTVAAVLLIIWRLPNYARYGLVNSVNTISRQVDNEHNLTPAEHEELQTYVFSMKEFIRNADQLNKANLRKFYTVRDAFATALEDGFVGRSEIQVIRQAVWQAKLPVVKMIVQPLWKALTAITPTVEATPAAEAAPVKK
jgi:hypothetical protein